jgi:hypothetical protein
MYLQGLMCRPNYGLIAPKNEKGADGVNLQTFRAIEELNAQIMQHKDRIFNIDQELRALAWEAIQRREAIKNLKREIKLTKRQLRREKWQKRLNTQQDIKELVNARYWPTEKVKEDKADSLILKIEAENRRAAKSNLK